MVGHLTSYNFYKIDLFKASNKVNAKPAYIKTDFSYLMTAGISKLAINLITWHCWLTHWNQVLVK